MTTRTLEEVASAFRRPSDNLRRDCYHTESAEAIMTELGIGWCGTWCKTHDAVVAKLLELRKKS